MRPKEQEISREREISIYTTTVFIFRSVNHCITVTHNSLTSNQQTAPTTPHATQPPVSPVGHATLGGSHDAGSRGEAAPAGPNRGASGGTRRRPNRPAGQPERSAEAVRGRGQLEARTAPHHGGRGRRWRRWVRQTEQDGPRSVHMQLWPSLSKFGHHGKAYGGTAP